MGKRILVVDDSSIMRKMIKETLRRGDHEVIGEAKSGEDAVKQYLSLEPDIVTMDITMRGMDGLAAAREIFKQDKNARIIFLSNLDEKKYGVQALELGAVGYVNKHKSKKILDVIDTI
ncbi:MAG: response regulator [Desulfobacteraceae bacterium]|nr:response regulator [Desulfobacteraceae bacterium]